MPKIVQEHNNGPHRMTRVNIKKNIALILCAYSSQSPMQEYRSVLIQILLQLAHVKILDIICIIIFQTSIKFDAIFSIYAE
jgi:hypothetical protein